MGNHRARPPILPSYARWPCHEPDPDCGVIGACCWPAGCKELGETVCEGFGEYHGHGTTCEEECLKGIPSVSEWGLIVMAVLVLTAGTVVVGRRSAAA